MKKLTTALLAAGLLLSASACTAPTKLATAETCDRIKTVVSNPTGTGKTGMIMLANRIRPIEAVSSDDLKPMLQSILDYADESVKDNPDSERLTKLEAEYQKAGSTYSQVCG